jgi:hypothetical protein
MRKIAELNMLVRERIDLPTGLELKTEGFREGWSFARSVNARRLEKKIVTRGWNFIKTSGGPVRSGVGDTSQEAIASALGLALRRVTEQFNAAEVERIELTRYPWFVLATVRVYPYRIQKSPVEYGPDELCALQGVVQESPGASARYPEAGSAMQQLKELLTVSRRSKARLQ